MPHQDFFIDGERIPSVTEIIGVVNKSWKEGWQRRVGFQEADRIMNEAGDLGRTAHDLVDQYLSGVTVDGDSKAHQLFKSWLKWYESSGYSVVCKEEFMFSTKKRFSGTLDAILK